MLRGIAVDKVELVAKRSTRDGEEETGRVWRYFCMAILYSSIPSTDSIFRKRVSSAFNEEIVCSLAELSFSKYPISVPVGRRFFEILVLNSNQLKWQAGEKAGLTDSPAKRRIVMSYMSRNHKDTIYFEGSSCGVFLEEQGGDCG